MLIWTDNETASYAELSGTEITVHYKTDKVHETETIQTLHTPVFGIDIGDRQRSLDLFNKMELKNKE